MAEFRSQPIVSRPAFRAVGLFASVLVLLICLAMYGVSGEADGKSSRRVVLGATKDKVTPNCGTRAGDRICRAEGKITGFQVFQRGATGKSFVVPYERGKVVAWSISLSNPTRKATKTFGGAQLPYFNKLFGSPSKARISILRPVVKGPKFPPRYKLIRASGTQTLNPYFGTEIKFAITNPLNVIKGDVVALTIPTWAPAFWVPNACNVDSFDNYIAPNRCANAKKHNTWRGSRAPDLCAIETDAFDRPNEALQKSHPQQKVNSVKRYGCYYDAARMLYTATVVSR